MKEKDTQAEKTDCHCLEDNLGADAKQRRYTWLNASGRVVSRKLTDYECQLEDEVEKLQDALFTISSHYAKIQFRLRQIASASDCERVCLLRQLERITCQGIDENTQNTELPILLRDCQSAGNVRTKQRRIISEIRSRVGDLMEDTGGYYCLATDSEYNMHRGYQHQMRQQMSHAPNCPCIVCHEERLEQRSKDRGYLTDEEEDLGDEDGTFSRESKSKPRKKRKKADKGSSKSSTSLRSRKVNSSRSSSDKLRSSKSGSQPIIGCTRLSYSELVAQHQGNRRQSKNSLTPKSSQNYSTRNVSSQSSRVRFVDKQTGSSRESNGSIRNKNQDKSTSTSPKLQQGSRRESTSTGQSQESKRTSAQSSKMHLSKNSSTYSHKEIPLQPCNSTCSRVNGPAQESHESSFNEQYVRRTEASPNQEDCNVAVCSRQPIIKPAVLNDNEQRVQTICEQRGCIGKCAKHNTCKISFSEEQQPQERGKWRKPVKKELKFCDNETCWKLKAQRKKHEKANNDANRPKKDKQLMKTMLKNTNPLYSVIPGPKNFMDVSRTSCLVYPNKYVPQNITKNDRRFCKLFCSKLRKGFDKKNPGNLGSNEEQRKNNNDTDC